MFVSKPNQTTTKADATQQTKKQQRKQTPKPTTRATHKTAVPFVQHLGSSSWAISRNGTCSFVNLSSTVTFLFTFCQPLVNRSSTFVNRLSTVRSSHGGRFRGLAHAHGRTVNEGTSKQSFTPATLHASVMRGGGLGRRRRGGRRRRRRR
jgi:hypothetical protein